MAFGGLVESISVDLVTGSQIVIVDFPVARSVQDVLIVNRTATAQRISLWYDYDGTNAGNAENFLVGFQIAANRLVHLTGIWVFSSGGRITAQAGSANTLTIHVSMADA